MELQIKITVGYNYKPVRIAKIPNTGNLKCSWRCEATWYLSHCTWECTLVELLGQTFWQRLGELHIVLLYDPAIALLDVYPYDVKPHVTHKSAHGCLQQLCSQYTCITSVKDNCHFHLKEHDQHNRRKPKM